MKRKKIGKKPFIILGLSKSFTIFALLFVSICFPSCGDDNSDSKRSAFVSTGEVDFGMTFAIITGSFNPEQISLGNNVEYGVEISRSELFVGAERKSTREILGNHFSVTFNSLMTSSNYYYRAYIKSEDVYYYGMTKSFMTKEMIDINLTPTCFIEKITKTTAEIGLEIKAPVPTFDTREPLYFGIAYYSYSKDSFNNERAFEKMDLKLNPGENGIYTFEVSYLKPNTLYYCCPFISDGNYYYWFGETISFKTDADYVESKSDYWVDFTLSNPGSLSQVAKSRFVELRDSVIYGVKGIKVIAISMWCTYSYAKKTFDDVAAIPDSVNDIVQLIMKPVARIDRVRDFEVTMTLSKDSMNTKLATHTWYASKVISENDLE